MNPTANAMSLMGEGEPKGRQIQRGLSMSALDRNWVRPAAEEPPTALQRIHSDFSIASERAGLK
jgi:hypothetical protein